MNQKAPVLETLTDEQIEESRRFSDDWLNNASEHGANREEVEIAIKWMYKNSKIESAPHFLRCDSLFQYVAVPGLLLICAADQNLFNQLEKELTDPLWSKSWQKVNDFVSAAPDLLKSMKENAQKLKDGVKPSRPGHKSASYLDVLIGPNIESKFDTFVYDSMETLKKVFPELLGTRAKLQLRKTLFTGIRDRQRGAVNGRFGLRFISTLFATPFHEDFLALLSSDTKTQLAELSKTYVPKEKGGIAAAMFGSSTKEPGVDALFEDALSSHYSLLEETERFVSTTSWYPLYGYVIERLDLDLDEKSRDWLKRFLTVKKNHVEMQAHKLVCLLCEPPQAVVFNDRGFLHNAGAPAIAFRDGFKIYANNGITVSEKVMLNPAEITLDQISAEHNAEIRRILIQQYGTNRYVEDSGAKVIDSDPEFGVLYRKEQQMDEPIVMVKVINATPEPDGSAPRAYFLRVPPYITTAKEAVAWTFNMEHNQYEPSEQS